jgi:hypothetical protein
LLDFNHPLLKKLATEAVGTYHHSLIVGNLTERAAEIIGPIPFWRGWQLLSRHRKSDQHRDIYREQ